MKVTDATICRLLGNPKQVCRARRRQRGQCLARFSHLEPRPHAVLGMKPHGEMETKRVFRKLTIVTLISDDCLRDEIHFVPPYLYFLVSKSVVNFLSKAVSGWAQGYNFFSSVFMFQFSIRVQFLPFYRIQLRLKSFWGKTT